MNLRNLPFCPRFFSEEISQLVGHFFSPSTCRLALQLLTCPCKTSGYEPRLWRFMSQLTKEKGHNFGRPGKVLPCRFFAGGMVDMYETLQIMGYLPYQLVSRIFFHQQYDTSSKKKIMQSESPPRSTMSLDFSSTCSICLSRSCND